MWRTSQRENLFKWVGPVPGNQYAIVTYKNGRKVKKSGKIQVRGRGPHLVTARRLGYRSYIKLHSLRTQSSQELALVMKPAQGPVLAQQILRNWTPDGRISQDVSPTLPRELALQLAKLSNIPEVFEVTTTPSFKWGWMRLYKSCFQSNLSAMTSITQSQSEIWSIWSS